MFLAYHSTPPTHMLIYKLSSLEIILKKSVMADPLFQEDAVILKVLCRFRLF